MKTNIKNKNILIKKLLKEFEENNFLSSNIYYEEFLKEIENILEKNKDGLYINEDKYDVFYSILPQYINEIIYYDNAIKFLSEYDPSFIESLYIAKELGIDYENLNSEVLANILLEKLVRDEVIEIFEKYFKE